MTYPHLTAMKKEGNEKIKPTILIVDDDEGMRDTLETILRDDYNVLKAGDGEKGLEILEENNVDIVFLDIILPGMDGLTALENVRKYHKDVDVIMGSVVKKAEHIVKAIKLGAYDYLTKGFDYDEIRFRISIPERELVIKNIIKRSVNFKIFIYFFPDTKIPYEELV